jgi:hypothetical protein
MAVEQQITQIVNTPGATASWQDDELSQATIFDLQTGQFDVQYNYRVSQQHWLIGKLRLFGQPFGRIAAPRLYAAASGVGPLLMISPYNAGVGAGLGIGATTQGGIAGFGGVQQASGGIFYAGNPSLAGDASALLQISYVGPLPAGATESGVVPTVAVSLLPDNYYEPLVTMPIIGRAGFQTLINSRTAVASQYAQTRLPPGPAGSASSMQLSFAVSAFMPLNGLNGAPNLWAGNHRLFAIARASSVGVTTTLLTANQNTVMANTAPVPVPPTSDWGLYDLGVISLKANETPQQNVQVTAVASSAASSGAALDLTAFVMLPNATTWFMNPLAIQASQYGFAPVIAQNSNGLAFGVYTNLVVVDDFVTQDQYLVNSLGVSYAPSVAGLAASGSRITPYTRGLIPRPQPYNGLPVIAILGMGQTSVPSQTITIPGIVGNAIQAGASWANPQNQRTMAQVNVVDRTRYVLP